MAAALVAAAQSHHPNHLTLPRFYSAMQGQPTYSLQPETIFLPNNDKPVTALVARAQPALSVPSPSTASATNIQPLEKFSAISPTSLPSDAFNSVSQAQNGGASSHVSPNSQTPVKIYNSISAAARRKLTPDLSKADLDDTRKPSRKADIVPIPPLVFPLAQEDDCALVTNDFARTQLLGKIEDCASEDASPLSNAKSEAPVPQNAASASISPQAPLGLKPESLLLPQGRAENLNALAEASGTTADVVSKLKSEAQQAADQKKDLIARVTALAAKQPSAAAQIVTRLSLSLTSASSQHKVLWISSHMIGCYSFQVV